MLNVTSSAPTIWMPDWASFSHEQLLAIQVSGLEVKYWMEVLARTGDTLVTEILRGVDELIVDQYYPEDTVEDHDSGSQYYFHAHSDRDDEYGHFHAYLMPTALPAGMRAPKAAPTGEHEDPFRTHCHLVAISMANGGAPDSLFSINHWSSQEACYTPEQILEMIDLFDINHAAPSWPANRWVGNMLRFFKPQIAELLRSRQQVLQQRGAMVPSVDPAADEAIEVTSQIRIDVDLQLAGVMQELNRRTPGGDFAQAMLQNGSAANPLHV